MQCSQITQRNADTSVDAGQADSGWHNEWVAAVCSGDFTLFRQELQECPTVRPPGSCSTDLGSRRGLICRTAVWKHCLCNLVAFAAADSCHPLSARPWDRQNDSFYFHDPHRTSSPTTRASLHNRSQTGSPGFLGDRRERQVRRDVFKANFCFEPRFLSEESLTLFVWGLAALYEWIHSTVYMI